MLPIFTKSGIKNVARAISRVSRVISQNNKYALFTQQSRSNTTESLVPYLRKVAEYVNTPKSSWQKTGFVFFQHFLDSFPDLLETLISLGVTPNRMIAASKSYSTCPHVTEKIKSLGVEVIPETEQLIYGGYHLAVNQVTSTLWHRALEKFHSDVEQVLAIDDGFYATSAVPSEILKKPFISVEQTSSGTTSPQSEIMPFPTISFANTAIKNRLETEVIVDEILYSLKNTFKIQLTNDAVYGIAGCGSLGEALAIRLIEQGYKVMVYDKNPSQTLHAQKHGALVAKKLNGLVGSVNVLIGTSGSDLTENLEDFHDAVRNITMLNFASSDSEFRTMLSKSQKQHNGQKNGHKKKINPFAPLVWHNNNRGSFLLPNGGFVGNFNRQNEISPPSRILVTRASIMGCITQGMLFFDVPEIMENPQRYMLDPRLQQNIAIDWLRKQPNTSVHQDLLKKFSDISWIEKNSSWATSGSLIRLNTGQNTSSFSSPNQMNNS